MPPRVNLELLLENIKKFVSGFVTHYQVASPANVATTERDASKSFWHEVKHSIYFMKVGSDLTLPTLQKAEGLVQGAVRRGLQFDLSFLQELLLTLSPVNLRVRPGVRRDLLRLISEELRKGSNDQHPLSIICHELQRDNDTGEVSEAAVNALLESIDSYKNSHSHIPGLSEQILKLECAYIALLRRDGQLQKAAERAFPLLLREEAKFDLLDSHSRSFEALKPMRLAATELYHVRMDQADYPEAVGVAVFVLTGVRCYRLKNPCYPPSIALLDLSPLIEDGKTVHALECIAKICEARRDYEQGLEWLMIAKKVAVKLSGGAEDATVEHIEEKITDFRARVG